MKVETSKIMEVIDKVKEGIVTEKDIREIADYYAMNYDMMACLKLFKELYFKQKQDLLNILINYSKSSRYSSFFQYFFDDSVKKTKDNYTKAISVIGDGYFKDTFDHINEILDFMGKVDVLYYCVGLGNIYFNNIIPFYVKEKKDDNIKYNWLDITPHFYGRKKEIDSIHFEYLQPAQILKIYTGCDEEEKEKCFKKIKTLPINSFTLKFSSDNIDEQLKMYNDYPPLTILELTYLEQILKEKYNYINGFDASFECYSKLNDYHEQNQHATNQDLFFEIIYNDIIPHYAKDDLKEYYYQSEIIVYNILEFKKYIEKCNYYNRTDIRIILRFSERNEAIDFEKATDGFSEDEEEELYNIEDYENAYIDYRGIDRDGYLSLDQFKRALNFYDGVADYINQLDLSEIEKYIVLFFLTKIFKKYKFYKEDRNIDDNYYWFSRNPYLIIYNLYIVCEGYSNFMVRTGKKVGLDIKKISVKFPNKNNHSRVITKFNDLKNDVKGIYIGDPTYDNHFLFSFEHMLLSREDVKKEIKESCIDEKEVYKSCYFVSRDIEDMFGQNTRTRLASLYGIKKEELFVESLGEKIDNMKLIGIFRNILKKIYFGDEEKVEKDLNKIIDYSNLDCLELYKDNSIESCTDKLFRVYKDINLTEDGTRYFTYNGIKHDYEIEHDSIYDYFKKMDINNNERDTLQLRFSIFDKSFEEEDYNNLVTLLKEALANYEGIDFDYVEDKLPFDDLFKSHLEEFYNLFPTKPPTKKLFVYIKVDKKEKLVDFDIKLTEIMGKINNIINYYCVSRKKATSI